jgi:hypothetical protein
MQPATQPVASTNPSKQRRMMVLSIRLLIVAVTAMPPRPYNPLNYPHVSASRTLRLHNLDKVYRLQRGLWHARNDLEKLREAGTAEARPRAKW